MLVITLKELLEAGVHFGHQRKKWNPKMNKYIFGERQGIHIIDLQKTMVNFEKAYQYLKEAAAGGKNILFVGTKKQVQEIVGEEGERGGVSYVNKRWLGGTLTNFETVKKRIVYLRELLEQDEQGEFSDLSKKELALINKEKMKLEKNFHGVKNMNQRPDIIFIIDPLKEKTALTEAKKMGIFSIALIDTNGDPDLVDMCIPGNDDAIRSVKLLVSRIVDGIVEGKASILKKGINEIQEKEFSEGEEKTSEVKEDMTGAAEKDSLKDASPGSSMIQDKKDEEGTLENDK